MSVSLTQEERISPTRAAVSGPSGLHIEVGESSQLERSCAGFSYGVVLVA